MLIMFFFVLFVQVILECLFLVPCEDNQKQKMRKQQLLKPHKFYHPPFVDNLQELWYRQFQKRCICLQYIGDIILDITILRKLKSGQDVAK